MNATSEKEQSEEYLEEINMKESSMKNKIRITERGEGGREMFEDEEIQRIDK